MLALAAVLLLDVPPQVLEIHGHRALNEKRQCVCIYERYQVPCGSDERNPNLTEPDPNVGPCSFRIVLPKLVGPPR